MDETTTSKVDNLDLTSRIRLDQNVLRLQITVNQFEIMDKGESVQDLLCDSLEARNIEVNFLFNFPIVLGIFVEVVSEKLSDDKEMLFVIEEINQLEEILLIKIFTVSVDISQKFDLINRLIEVILIVLNNLHANHLLCVDVIALNGFREGGTAEIFDDLVATCNNTIDDNREVFGLLEACLLSIENNAQVVAVIDDTIKLSWVELVI